MYIQERVPWENFNDDLLSFYKAISVDMIDLDIRHIRQTNPELALRTGVDITEKLEQAREKVESHGLKLNDVFMAGWNEITLAKADMDEKIEAWCRMIECLGKAGIPNLGWNFKPMGNFRTTSDIGRGGVKYSTFDYAEFDKNRPKPHEPQVSEDQMWQRMEKFLKAAIPVAEKAGVRMALHPDDPPIPEPLGGVAQICSTLEQFRRIFDIVPSASNAMLFCQGCMTELLGEGVYDAITEMASKNKIAWVHFRNVRGRLPRFAEVFLDEGDIDMRRAMEIYRNNGFNGPFMMDHTPTFPQQSAGWVGIAYAVGYIRSLIQTVYG
jgi:mannonate dehydratase